MDWYVKKKEEDDNIIKIGYSHGENHSCDGLIVYDKKTDTFEVKTLSKGCHEHTAKKTVQFLWDLVGTPKLCEKVFHICTG